MNGHEPVNKFISYLGEDGSRAHKYWNFTGPWCCGEVAMVMKQTTGNLFYDGKKVVSCPTAIAWCKTHLQKIPTKNAQFGDIIFFDWNRNGVPDHIGMVEYVSGSTVHTLEGNTGSPARVRRKVRASYILGIFRPKYTPPKPQDYKVTVDGEWGYHTCLATQYVLGGLTLDGVLGKATVKAIQKKVGAKDDGVWGEATCKAMSKALGIVPQTTKSKALIKAWQKWLNAEIDKKITPTPPKPAPTPTPPTPDTKGYTGEFPTLPIKVTTEKGKALAVKAKQLAWPLGTAEKKYKYSGGAPTSACKTAMNKRGYKKKVSLSDCGYFINTVIHATLGKKVKVLGSAKRKFPSISGFKVVHTGKIGSGVLKAGDIIRYKKKSGQHVVMYVGDGVIAEAGRKTRFGRMIKSSKYNASNVKHSTIQVLRVIESVAEKNYLSKGDSGAEVTKWQKFLNWVGCNCGTPDGDFGDKTVGATKAFQLKYGLTADGSVGDKTIAKAKEIKR